MISIDPTILFIMGEVILGLIVVLVAVSIYFIRIRKRDIRAVNELQSRLKDNIDKRKELFEEVLTTASGTDDDETVTEQKEIAQTWVDKENKFYNRLVEMYMQRNSSALNSLDNLLHDYTASYLDVITLMRERADTEQAGLAEEFGEQLDKLEQGGQKLATEVKSLKSENQRLSQELEKAYAEVDQAMREYSKAFKEAKPTKVENGAAAPDATTVNPAPEDNASGKPAQTSEVALEDEFLFQGLDDNTADEAGSEVEESVDIETTEDEADAMASTVAEEEDIVAVEMSAVDEQTASGQQDAPDDSRSESDVINLAEDEAPDLTVTAVEDDDLLGDALPEEQMDVDLDDVDEAALLKQLDSIEEDDDFLNELEKLGEQEDEAQSPAKNEPK